MRKRAKTFWSRGGGELDTILESHEITLRKFDRAMAFSGITPTETIGKRFDPRTMRAISVTGPQAGMPEGEEIVTEEVCGGFSRGEEVLRIAEVIVERRPRQAS